METASLTDDDKWLYLLVGMLFGIPLGMIIIKYLKGNGGENAGATYTYDSNGRLTSYMPVASGQSSPVVVQSSSQQIPSGSSAVVASSGVSLSELGLTQESAKELGIL